MRRPDIDLQYSINTNYPHIKRRVGPPPPSLSPSLCLVQHQVQSYIRAFLQADIRVFNDFFSFGCFTSASVIVGRGPHRDRTLQERVLQRVNITIYVALCTLASLGIILAITFLVINIMFRKHRFDCPLMAIVLLLGY